MQVKTRGSHLACKVKNKCLNAYEQRKWLKEIEMVPFIPLLSVTRQCCETKPDSRKRKLKLLQGMAVAESKLDLSKAHN